RKGEQGDAESGAVHRRDPTCGRPTGVGGSRCLHTRVGGRVTQFRRRFRPLSPQSQSPIVSPPNVETAEYWALPGLTEGRRAAARDVWGAFWSSRAVVWGAGMFVIVAFGWATSKTARLDPVYLTSPFSDSFLNLLTAPAARFDSVWYISISQHG